MPWMETNVEMERLKFIAALSESNEPFAEICRRFGISRQTGYEWKRPATVVDVKAAGRALVSTGSCHDLPGPSGLQSRAV